MTRVALRSKNTPGISYNKYPNVEHINPLLFFTPTRAHGERQNKTAFENSALANNNIFSHTYTAAEINDLGLCSERDIIII